MARQVDGVCSVGGRQGIGEGAHISGTAAPAMKEEERRGIVGAVRLDVQVLIGHRLGHSTNKNSGSHFWYDQRAEDADSLSESPRQIVRKTEFSSIWSWGSTRAECGKPSVYRGVPADD